MARPHVDDHSFVALAAASASHQQGVGQPSPLLLPPHQHPWGGLTLPRPPRLHWQSAQVGGDPPQRCRRLSISGGGEIALPPETSGDIKLNILVLDLAWRDAGRLDVWSKNALKEDLNRLVVWSPGDAGKAATTHKADEFAAPAQQSCSRESKDPRYSMESTN